MSHSSETVGDPKVFSHAPGYVTFRASRKFSDGNYGSYEYSVGISIPVGVELPAEMLDDTYQTALTFVDEKLTALLTDAGQIKPEETA